VFVYLRSAVRPPVAERASRPTADEQPQGVQFWELPAGLVEPGEDHPGGLRRTAARETGEELGFELPDAAFEPLGHGIYPTPAVIAERQFFFRVEVDPDLRGEPSLDGSPLEQSGVVFAVRLEAAIESCRKGHLLDGKTELGLRRLHEALVER
jgi:ADP-ribose pyrophosphatase